LASALLASALLACAGSAGSNAGPARAKPAAARPADSKGDAVWGSCVATGPELCLNAQDDDCNGVADEGCGLETGLAQFTIAWDAPGSDVDLHVIDPNGQLVEVGKLTRAGLVKQRDCPGRRDDCHGVNLENVYLEAGRKPVRGRFVLRVRLEKLGDEDLPVAVSLAARLGAATHQARFALERVGDERRIELVW
jgi:tRNA (guanosine-2'-O-)-methyltransferase